MRLDHRIHRLWRKPGKHGRAAKGTLDTPRFVGSAAPIPTSVTSPHPGNWYMLGNDKWGDCVFAACAHVVRSVDKVNGGKFALTSQEVVNAYFAYGISQGEAGPHPDGGAGVDQVLQIWKTTGIFGTQIKDYASLDVTNHDEIKSAIATLVPTGKGAVILGVTLPQSAEDQFPGPWTVRGNPKIIGGHAISATGYDENWLNPESWGCRIKASWEFIATYCDEGYAVTYQ